MINIFISQPTLQNPYSVMSPFII